MIFSIILWKQKSITNTISAMIREAYNTATALLDKFGVRRPCHFMDKFVVRFLKICNYLFHRNKICTGGEARTPDSRFWRPVLYQLSYSRVLKISSHKMGTDLYMY
jgi:hypothetical protein